MRGVSKHAPNMGGGGPVRCDFGSVGGSPLSISSYNEVAKKIKDVGTGRSEVYHGEGEPKRAPEWSQKHRLGPPWPAACASAAAICRTCSSSP